MTQLDPQKVLETMEKISLFHDFNSAEKESLANLTSHLETYKKGEVIIRQNAEDTSIYILLRGKVKITRNEEPRLELARLNPGNFFGEISFLTKGPRITNAIALEETLALKIDAGFYDQVSFDIRNKLKDKITLVLIRRIDNMNRILLELVR